MRIHHVFLHLLMSRKRKSAPPRRLDAAAREEHNWEASKDDLPAPAPLLAPTPPAVDDLLVAPATTLPAEKKSEAEQVSSHEPSEEDNHRIHEKQVRKKLDKLQELYEQDFPRAAKKPRKTILSSFSIPFNKTEGDNIGGEDFVELTSLVVNCDRHNEEFYANINAGITPHYCLSHTYSTHHFIDHSCL